MRLQTLEQLNEKDHLVGSRILLRLALNCPVKREGESVEVTDDTRIRAALPTIRYLLEKTDKLAIVSHFGRPKGKYDPKFSLAPGARCLAKHLDTHEISAAFFQSGTVDELRLNDLLA